MLTTYNEFKLGDRVYWHYEDFSDYGSIVEDNGKVFFLSEEGDIRVNVKWDSDKSIASADIKNITKVISPVTTEEEQKAITLLLSLGYTISKNPK